MALFFQWIILFVAFFLQTTVVSDFNIWGVVSNCFFVVLFFIASMNDIKKAICFGTVFGVLTDLICAKIFGINTALLLLVAVGASYLTNRVREKKLIYYIISIFLFSLMFEYISALFLVSSSINVTMGYVFLHKVIPTAIVNVGWMIIIHVLYGRAKKKMVLGRKE